MIDRNIPDQLSAAHLMQTVRALSVGIGPRRPTSAAEHDAARWVQESVRALDPRWLVLRQPFRSVKGFSVRLSPLALLIGISLFYGLKRSRKAHWLGGLFSIGLSVLTRDAFLVRPAVWESWIPRGESQNVLVRIPPRRRTTRRVVFLAHLDSGVHRIALDPRVARELPRTFGALTLLALTGGVLTVLAGRAQRWRALRALITGGAFSAAALGVLDETGESVAGANDNASGVAALLGLAAALHERPLESTEVVLAFTGSATAVGTGADMLAATYGEAWKDALWVVVNDVGTGELCWATRHGISPYAYYSPHPDAVAVMERAADARPDLGLMGKAMLTLDEVAILRDHGLRAVALLGYDRVTGMIPNWWQRTDTIDAIQPAALERAAHACWTAAQVVDQSERWPLTR